MTDLLTIRASRGVGSPISGLALIADVPFSARYDLDRKTGVISRMGHPLHGACITDRVLIFPSVQGGVAGGWAFIAMRGAGVGPRGLVFGAVNPVIVQGAVAAGIPLLGGIDPWVFERVHTGDFVTVDPSEPALIVAAAPRSTSTDGEASA